MMLGRMSRKARPVLRDKSGEEAPLWRMFCPDFKGQVEILTCGAGEEGWNYTIINNFRVPYRVALDAVLPEGKGDLGALGDPTATGVAKQTVLKFIYKRQRKTRKTHEAVVVPPLMPEVAGGTAAAGGSTTGTKPVDDKKRKVAVVAGREKVPKFRKTRATVVPKPQTAIQLILGGLGTPFETARARGLPRQNWINQLSSMLVGSSIIANAIMEDYIVLVRRKEETIRLRAEAEAMVKAAREGAEQLEKDKVVFEKLKQTETWAASVGLKQVGSLAKLLSNERKGWREACAKENEKLFRLLQELNNLNAANAALVKEKAAVEAAANEAEARSAKALEDADADNAKINKAVEELKVSSHATEAEAQARQAEEARDGLATSLSQVTTDHLWMGEHGIGHIVETILDAPENASAVAKTNERAHQARFKAGENECLSHVNPFFKSRFTDERSGFQGVDTEAAYATEVDAYN
ncbi:hypothetical protein Hdeb2414_s0014g00422861 [Helianthus debilis subsp. tardiflorus]